MNMNDLFAIEIILFFGEAELWLQSACFLYNKHKQLIALDDARFFDRSIIQLINKINGGEDTNKKEQKFSEFDYMEANSSNLSKLTCVCLIILSSEYPSWKVWLEKVRPTLGGLKAMIGIKKIWEKIKKHMNEDNSDWYIPDYLLYF